jgi:hypothetical protein
MRRIFCSGVIAALAIVSAAAGGAQEASAPANNDQLDITAFAVNMSNVATGANAVVEIRIDSWSTPEERQKLLATATEKDKDALLRELQDAKSHGRFSIPGLVGPDPQNLRLGHDIRYAWQTMEPDGGRRIILATDRYIGFWEAQAQPRTIDYPFTLFEIRVNKDGEGEGKMAVATKITFNKRTNTMELENYTSEPVRLNNVRVKVRS